MRHSNLKNNGAARLRSSFSSCVLPMAVAVALLATSAPAWAGIVEDSSPGDPVTGTSTNSPANQGPAKAIDNNVTTKYLNFDKLNTGLTITPQGNQPVRGLTLFCAEDAPERDVTSFVLEGSNDGTNFTRIASNAVPDFIDFNSVQSFAFANTNVFNRYRLRFPTIINAATANSMQTAEVELLHHEEIPAPDYDHFSVILPPGATDGGMNLFDRMLRYKLSVLDVTNADTIVSINLAGGAKVLKGFELIGASDDLDYPGSRPNRVTVAGSTDGTTYTHLATVVPVAPSSNMQIQEFGTSSNLAAYALYRITFGPPVSGDRLQVGEMRLFGDAPPLAPEIAVYTGNTTNATFARASGAVYSFPYTATGYVSSAAFTIRNLGNTNLSGLTLTKTGTNVNDFTWSPLNSTNLSPNGTVTFSVNFAPTAEGERCASIWIFSNDSDENPFEIRVRGTAIPDPNIVNPIVDVSVPGDLVTGTSANSPANQGPTMAIDNTVASKYLNFDKLNTGLTFIPSGNQPVRGLTLISAEDALERDPTSFVLDGSNDGINFTRIASNAVPIFDDRNIIQSFAFPNTNVFTRYRLRFPTVRNPSAANSMQIAEVELLQHEELTTKWDGASLSLPPGADYVGSHYYLIDRNLQADYKLEVIGITNADVVINFDLATESKVLKAFELIGATDDLTYPERRPSRVTVAGSPDGVTYFEIATRYPAAPASNSQIREFSTESNTNAYRHYRFILGPPPSGYRLQLCEIRLFGEARPAILDASVPDDPATATSANFMWYEGPSDAIDNTATTTYRNFDKLNTGLTITPRGNQPVRALTLISAFDAPERDPSSFVLEASNDGTNFTRIASNAVPPFITRQFIQSFPVPNTNAFYQYRLRFPTIANVATADSMQIAEVELLYHEEITSSNDAVSIVLPPGASDVRGVGSLFDRQLGSVRKLEVAPINNADTIVNITLAAGAKVLRGFELIGASDDTVFPGRRPSRVTVAGSADGSAYTVLATIIPPDISSDMQIQEFATESNTNAFVHYRITFGPPYSGNRLQVGEMRLFGGTAPVDLAPPTLSILAEGNTVLVSWQNNPGFALESKTPLSAGVWNAVGIAPVLSNGTNTITVPATEAARFFRLRK